MASIGNIIDSNNKKEKGNSMNMNSFLESERKSFERFKNYQLPNGFKKIGLGLSLIAFIAIIIIGIPQEFNNLELIAKNILIVGLLLISISKEKIEDELVKDLRMQSYSFAFIIAVIYSILLPFVNYFFDIIAKNETDGIQELGDFSILWMLLSVQVGFFHFLKKMHQ